MPNTPTTPVDPGLNRIEAQFSALRYFALDGTDHNSHAEQASMIRRYIALAEPVRSQPPQASQDHRQGRDHPEGEGCLTRHSSGQCRWKNFLTGSRVLRFPRQLAFGVCSPESTYAAPADGFLVQRLA